MGNVQARYIRRNSKKSPNNEGNIQPIRGFLDNASADYSIGSRLELTATTSTFSIPAREALNNNVAESWFLPGTLDPRLPAQGRRPRPAAVSVTDVFVHGTRENLLSDSSFLDNLCPPAPSTLFTGRTQELMYMDSFFRQNPGGELVVRGISGSGKTQLALKFAQVTKLHSGVLYVNATTASSALPKQLYDPEFLKFQVAMDGAARRWDPRYESDTSSASMSEQQPLKLGLVIFDGLTPPGFCDPRYNRIFREHLSRASGFQKLSIVYLLDNYYCIDKAHPNSYCLSQSLHPEDAAQLLIKAAYACHQSFSLEDKQTSGEIAMFFGYFPPTIIQVGKAIRNSKLTLQTYRLMSNQQQHEWMEMIGVSEFSPWRFSYDRLTKPARLLLQLLAFLPIHSLALFKAMLTRARTNITTYQPLGFPNADVEKMKSKANKLLSRFTSANDASIQCNATFNTALSDLKGCFLLPSEDDSQRLRPAASAWVKALVSNHSSAATFTAYLLAVAIGPENEPGDECRTFRSQLEPLVDNILVEHPGAFTYHHPGFVLVYEACHRHKESTQLQESTLEQCRRELGQRHTDTILVTDRLAKTYCTFGRWGDAKKLQSILLDHRKDVLGKKHPETLSAMCDLASTLSRLGRWEDAESLQERVCDGRKRALGKTHPDTLSAMHTLAWNYSEQGRWQEAQELHQSVLQDRRRTLGEGHADTLRSMHSLATRHRESRQSTMDAEQSNIQVLEARKKALGHGHPDTLSSLIALAEVYRRKGQWRTATDLATEVLDAQRKHLGRDHIDTIHTMNSLASWYSDHGQLSDAAALHVEILESRRAVYGNDRLETLKSMGELVSTYWKQGLWVQAESLHLELLKARACVLGNDHPDTLSTSLDLAMRYQLQCRWKDASTLYKTALDVKQQDQELEEDDPEIISIQHYLNLTLFALSLDVFVVSPAVPIEAVVAHFTRKAELKDYSSLLQEVSNLPTAPIAWGGFSNIYRVTLQDGSELAVKCLKSAHGEYKQVKQTIRELNTWSKLRHKSIADLLGLALFQNQLAMVSSWNKKGNVMKFIEEQPSLDRYALCAQVVNAVVYLHESNVIHGDLKGANILVSDDGTLQLTDFGLAIMHDPTIQFSKSMNEVGGTLRWMAPELVFGNEIGGNLTQRSTCPLSQAMTRTENEEDSETSLCKETDIYALGMTMLELLTGKQPFKEIEKDAGVILALGQGKRPRRPQNILDRSTRGAPLWEILEMCWSELPIERPTASQVETLILGITAD